MMQLIYRQKILTASVLIGIGVCPIARTALADELIVIRSGESSARALEANVLGQDDSFNSRPGDSTHPSSLDDMFADGNGGASRGGEPCNSVNDCPPLEQHIIDACGIYTCDDGTCVIGSTCNVFEMCDGTASCDQIIFLDANLTYLAGPENEPFHTPFTPSDFDAARIGQAPQLTIYFNDGACNGDIPQDLAAAGVNTSVFVLDIPSSSALYAIDFEVTGPTIENASIDLYIRPNDTLGGGPNQGVYINGMPLSGDTTGGTCGAGSPLMNIYRTDIGSLLHVGTNTLYLNITHTGGDSGLLLSAEIRVDTDGPLLVHVDDDAPPGGDGTSWPTAFNSLQDAIENLEASADPNRKIWLAGGVYKPTRLEDPDDPRSMTFRLHSHVDIIGGFAGTERNRSERVAGTPPTIISGDINGDDVFTPSHPTWNENAYHIFTGDRFLKRANLTSLTLTHGKANGTDLLEDVGSAIFLTSFGDVTLSDCAIDENYSEFEGTIQLAEEGKLTMVASGASGNINQSRNGFISARFFSHVNLRDCNFSTNDANRGAAVSLVDGSTLVAEDCTFSDNTTFGSGGAIFAFATDSDIEVDTGAHVTLTRCDFLRNETRSDGGAVYFVVGGPGNTGSLMIDDCNFDQNKSTSGDGGAVYAWMTGTSWVSAKIIDSSFTGNEAPDGTGGAVDTALLAPFDIVRTRFAANQSKWNGAAVNITHGVPVISDCTFVENTSSLGHGAVTITFSDEIELSRCTFIRNSAREFGGALSFGGFSQTADIVDCVFLDNDCRLGSGGAISTFVPDTQIVNSLFVGNRAGQHGGVIAAWDSFTLMENCTVFGNIAPFGESGGVYGRNSFIVVRNSIMRGNTDAGGGGLAGQVDGDNTTAFDIDFSNVEGVALADGNIDTDAMFNDVSGVDGIIGSEDDDFRLSPASPCIDVGSNALVPAGVTTDLDGFDRFVDHPVAPGRGAPIVDMGAYEARFADCDHSGAITLGDYAGFGNCLTGPTSPTDPGCGCLDLNVGGTVDLADYAEFQRILPAP